MGFKRRELHKDHSPLLSSFNISQPLVPLTLAFSAFVGRICEVLITDDHVNPTSTSDLISIILSLAFC